MTGTDNVGNAASIISTVKVDTTAPSVPTLAYSSESNVAVNGTYVYYRPGATSGSFTVTASSTDSETGIASYSFPSLGSGWTATPGSLGVETYTWSSANPTTASGNLTVTATNNAGLTSSGSNTTNPFTMVADSTAPTGGAVTVNGTPATEWLLELNQQHQLHHHLAHRLHRGPVVDPVRSGLEHAHDPVRDPHQPHLWLSRFRRTVHVTDHDQQHHPAERNHDGLLLLVHTDRHGQRGQQGLNKHDRPGERNRLCPAANPQCIGEWRRREFVEPDTDECNRPR